MLDVGGAVDAAAAVAEYRKSKAVNIFRSYWFSHRFSWLFMNSFKDVGSILYIVMFVCVCVEAENELNIVLGSKLALVCVYVVNSAWMDNNWSADAINSE